MLCSWLHPAPNAVTPASLTLSQTRRLMLCSWPHPAPNADIPASVTLLQYERSMIWSWLHPWPNGGMSRRRDLIFHFYSSMVLLPYCVHGTWTPDPPVKNGMFNREVASTGSLEKTSDFVFFLPFLLSLFARRHNTREERQQSINRRCETDMVRIISYDTYDRIW